jgi:alpha-tubulin suppressor-like RCC1 family protein
MGITVIAAVVSGCTLVLGCGGQVPHPEGNGGTSSTSSTGGTGGAHCGGGPQCSQASDCGPTESACKVAVCKDGCCGTQDVAADEPIASQSPGDCHAWACEKGTPTKTSAVTVGEPCSFDGGKVCGPSGACVACVTGADCADSAVPSCCQGTCVAGVAEVVTYEDQTCARKTDGTLWCWGRNDYGQVGDGTTNVAYSPTQVTALGPGVVQVAVALRRTCARLMDGTLWCWGENDHGGLGNGTTQDSHLPVQVAALGTSVADVATGEAHTCARKTDGTVWCWGGNFSGQVGNGTITDQLTPVQVAAFGTPGTSVVQLAAGRGHTCARMSDNTLWCWGSNAFAELGDGTTSDSRTPVHSTDFGGGIAQIALGYEHFCLRMTDGTLWCSGANKFGQLGIGTRDWYDILVPVTALGANVAEVTAGTTHTCARKTDGTLWCWGSDDKAELGDGKTGGPVCELVECRLSPVQVVGIGSGVTQIAAGNSHTCARKSDGTLWCWGYTIWGEIGTGPGPGSGCYGTCEPAPIQIPVSVCP